MGDKKVKFNINDNMKYPEVAEECSAVYEFIKQPIVEEWDSYECEQEKKKAPWVNPHNR